MIQDTEACLKTQRPSDDDDALQASLTFTRQVYPGRRTNFHLIRLGTLYLSEPR